MLEVGHKSSGLILILELEVLAILKGDAKSFYPLNGGGARRVLSHLEGGRAKCSRPAIFSFWRPPPFAVMNDQSLNVAICDIYG